jgi:hypothetical protein
MTESSHAHLGIRLPDSGNGSRTGSGSLTRQSANGAHQLATPSSTQVPTQRLTQPSASSAAPPQPVRRDNLGPGPQLGHITHENNRAHTDRQTLQDETTPPRAEDEAIRPPQQLGSAAEPPRNEAAPADNAVPNPDPMPVRLPIPAQNQLFVDDDTLA